VADLERLRDAKDMMLPNPETQVRGSQHHARRSPPAHYLRAVAGPDVVRSEHVHECGQLPLLWRTPTSSEHV
jgi:hypothetical protein